MKAKPPHENPAINHTAFIDTMILRNIILSKWQFVAASTLAFILLLASSGRAEEMPANDAKKKQDLIEQCLTQMNEPHGEGRAMAFHMLQKLGPDADTAVPALSEALKHKDSYVRIQSAYTLWKIDRRASAIQILSTELNEKANKARDRAMAAEVLGLIGADAKAALPTLAEATKDQDAEIRVSAAWALWAVDKRLDVAKPVLIAGLKDEDPYVAAKAAEALKKIDPQAADVPNNDKIKKMPPADIADAKTVAKAFIIALANKNVREAAQYIIPEEREEMMKELENGIPPLPKNPEVEIRIKDDGIQADVTIINAEKAKSGRPIGLDMKLSNGKWWIVK